jgi:acetyltransferase-like isoleucine patch superfamily enzyme
MIQNHSTPRLDDSALAEPSAAHSSGEPSGWTGGLGALGRRIVRIAREEVRADPRKVAAHAVSSFLPQFSFNRTRTALLRAAGFRIGAFSAIMGGVNVTGPGKVTELLSIGERTIVSGPLHINLGAPIRIGNGVNLGHDVWLLTIDHEVGPSEYRCGLSLAAPITIGDGAWIGSRVTILPGISIGEGAIVGTGAVVTQDVPANTLVAGIPARFVRDLQLSERRSPRQQRASFLEE